MASTIFKFVNSCAVLVDDKYQSVINSMSKTKNKISFAQLGNLSSINMSIIAFISYLFASSDIFPVTGAPLLYCNNFKDFTIIFHGSTALNTAPGKSC